MTITKLRLQDVGRAIEVRLPKETFCFIHLLYKLKNGHNYVYTKF